MGYIKTHDGRTIKDITGNKYNKLTAIRYDHSAKNHHSFWLFKCDCGNEKVIDASTVTKKNAEVKSCGCQNNAVRLSGNNRRIHGDCGTRLYKVWKSMHKRCSNIQDKSYKKWYSPKGIKVCKEWDDYRVFKEWALANGYDENADYMQCTLDRIDVNGDYFPDNCRWVNCKVQANNKSNNRMIDWRGETHNLTEWSQIIGIPMRVLRSRYYTYGWSVEEMFCVPVGVRRKEWRKNHEASQ